MLHVAPRYVIVVDENIAKFTHPGLSVQLSQLEHRMSILCPC
jgi:hypothetical protein